MRVDVFLLTVLSIVALTLVSQHVTAAAPSPDAMPNPTPEQIDAANAAVLEAGQGGMVFPADSRVANVKAFGAKGDGVHDDTAAFQAALQNPPKNRLIYVPNGTYLIGDTLRWGERQTRQILQGQSRDGAIIKLKDGCPGYDDPTQPKAMVWTGQAPAQRFRNGIFNLTFDTGKDNPGAIGVQFIANNSGSVKDVLIRSGDSTGRGVIGLDLGYTNEQGPCLIKRVTVEGFDTGVFAKHAVDGVVAEHITLRGQRVVGWLNGGQCVSLRGLKSTNAVPAYHNREQASLTAMIDSELIGTGDAANVPAIINNRGLFARNVKTTGYKIAVENTDGTKQNAQGPDIKEFVSHEVLTLGKGSSTTSLNLPIQETPEIAWGDPSKWVSITTYEPVPVEITRPDGKVSQAQDWSPALQQAIDSGARTVYVPHRTRGTITLLSDVIVRGNVERIIGLESEFRGIYGPLDTGHKLTIITRNDKPLVIERCDAMYTGIQFRHEGKGQLVLRHLSMNEYNSVTKTQGSGDLFIEDFAFGGGLFIEGGNVWARQYNPEGEALKIKTDNVGGNLWVLGLKTEGDTQLVNTRNGGRTEIVGGFIYANKANDPDKVMFRVDATSSLSFTVGEWVLRKQPFNLVKEIRGDEERILKHGEAYGRGQGSMIPLFVGRPAPKP